MGLEIPEEGEITNGDLSYTELIDHIEDGIIHIPEFQREFVWTEQKILDLLDSIYKAFPVGSLIFWVTSEDFAYSAPIGNTTSSDSVYKHRFFVIDGQQRLKSLYHAAKSEELAMETGMKKIEVAFDLERERFILDENIRERKRSMYPIPGIDDENLVFDFLQATADDELLELRDRFELSEYQFDNFTYSLDNLGLIGRNEGEYSLTSVGRGVLDDRNPKRVGIILANNVKYVKETLQIIQESPGISRWEATPTFQDLYGKSDTTAYQQFGRRCRWLRSLDLVEKHGSGYEITEMGEAVLEEISEIEAEIQSRFVPLDRILVDQADLDWDYLGQFSDERRGQINQLRKIFSNYELSIILVNKTDWEEVCDIFERINTQGQHLTVVDLMIAKTWSGEEFNLRDELEAFKDEIGEEIPDITILQALSLNVAGKCTRQAILGLQSGDVKRNWTEVIESLRKSIDFLENNLNLPTFDLLPYPAQLVPLSRFFYEMGNRGASNAQTEKLVRWFWKSSLSNRFDSAVETKLEVDGASMEQIAAGELTEFQYSYLQRTVDDIINQEYTLRNAFVKMIICLFASQHPLNPVNNSPVSYDNFSRYKQSEMHHIFPRNYLREQDVDKEHINSIANIMYLPANINKQSEFSDAPAEYLSQIDNPDLEDALTTHLIPNLDESGLLDNDFDRFLNYRAKQILRKIEEVTGEEDIMTSGRGLSPQTPFTNEMHVREVIRQSDGYLYWFDKYFTRQGLEFLADEVDRNDVEEVRILTGTAQTDHNIRSDFEKFKKELEAFGVTTEMRVLVGETAREIHDRWVIAENQTYNIPSINTIASNQYAEITKSATRPPFSEWWGDSLDILEEWNDIQQHLD